MQPNNQIPQITETLRKALTGQRPADTDDYIRDVSNLLTIIETTAPKATTAPPDAYDTILAHIKAGRYLPDPNQNHVPAQVRRREATARFRTDLLQAYGLTDHPRAARALQIAWDLGHSAGHEDVLGYFDDLAGLLR